MTTAHRPTWVSAKGGVKNHGFSSVHICAKDQNGETRLKYRQVGQSSKAEMDRRDLVDELEKREYDHLSEKNKLIAMIENEEKKIDAIPLLKERAEQAAPNIESKYNDADIDINGDDNNDDDDEFDSSRLVKWR
jgi:protein CWC15